MTRLFRSRGVYLYDDEEKEEEEGEEEEEEGKAHSLPLINSAQVNTTCSFFHSPLCATYVSLRK